jgi:hypothetical protein
MVVKLKVSYGSGLRKADSFSRQLAIGTATLLQPAAVMAYVLGCWRLGADLHLTGQFAIMNGLFSHWQVWFALGAVMQFVSVSLFRLARRSWPANGPATL